MQTPFLSNLFPFFVLVKSAKQVQGDQGLCLAAWQIPKIKWLVKKSVQSLLLLFAVFTLSGCGQSVQYKVEQTELQTKLNQSFPLQVALPPIVDLYLHTPKLTLLPEQNRLQTQIQLSLLSPLINSKEPVNGSLSIDYGLFYRPEDGSILLKNAHIGALSLDNVRQKWVEQAIGAAINSWLQQASLDTVLYTLSKEKLQKIQALNLNHVAFHVLSDALQITIKTK